MFDLLKLCNCKNVIVSIVNKYSIQPILYHCLCPLVCLYYNNDCNDGKRQASSLSPSDTENDGRQWPGLKDLVIAIQDNAILDIKERKQSSPKYSCYNVTTDSSLLEMGIDQRTAKTSTAPTKNTHSISSLRSIRSYITGMDWELIQYVSQCHKIYSLWYNTQ